MVSRTYKRCHQSPAVHQKSDLLDDLLNRHGEILRAEELRKALGYKSKRSLYRAIAEGKTPVAVFKLSGQSTWAARTRDVAHWISALGGSDPNTQGGDAGNLKMS